MSSLYLDLHVYDSLDTLKLTAHLSVEVLYLNYSRVRGFTQATATECKYVPEGRGPLQQLGIEAIFAPVPQPLMQNIIRGQIEKSLSQAMNSAVVSPISRLTVLLLGRSSKICARICYHLYTMSF